MVQELELEIRDVGDPPDGEAKLEPGESWEKGLFLGSGRIQFLP